MPSRDSGQAPIRASCPFAAASLNPASAMGNMETSPRARRLVFVGFACLTLAQWRTDLCAQELPHNTCQRPSAGSVVPEPEDLRSRNGDLTVDLTIHNYVEAGGSVRYCYTTEDGKV